MRAHNLIYSNLLASNMRPVNVSLDATTWELAKQKDNFSEWVRNQLRSERNKAVLPMKYCEACKQSMRTNHVDCPIRTCTGWNKLVPTAPVGQWISTGPGEEE